jgi:broad specificity phosphatase PhoE
LIVVRHALPEVVPGVAPHLWELGPEGRAAARALAARIDPTRVVTSDEPKARQTAEEIAAPHGAEIVVDARLREVARPAAWDEGYRDTALRYVAGEALAGWEPHEAVVARFAAACGAGDVIVTHGLAMTLWLASEGLVAARGPFWAQLAFPDAYSALAGHLRRVH